MRRVIPVFFFVPAAVLSLCAQPSFTNRNDLLARKYLHSGVPVGIADMNGDGLDDIISVDEARHLTIQYQTPDPSRPFVTYNPVVTLDAGRQNDICIADFNNDGALDILTVGSYDRVKVLYGIAGTYEYLVTHIQVTPFFSQAASTGDFNHDGWVDAVLLNDNGLNVTLMNDGAGQLVRHDHFNFVTIPPSDNSGNYGCLYTDFDMDGDLDFYIAKCRIGVGNPGDPRRINVLFINDGQGNYTEAAAAFGLASGAQSWTADFGDFDNDGDLDCFITQHDRMSELYENISNDTFINITSQAGLNIGGVPLQGMFADADNDGFLDILVTGDRTDFYRNNGDRTFTRQSPFGDVVLGTYALGDLDHNGFIDVYASRVIPFNMPDLLREDILFLNDGNNHHFLSLALTDTAGNPPAIGAMAILYGPWGIQTREVRGGEQYGVSNGHHLLFGLGEATSYDSLVIRWPGGTRERYDGLLADAFWHIQRGGCRFRTASVWPLLEVLCDTMPVLLTTQPAFSALSWSHGAAGDSIWIGSGGIYYASYADSTGCVFRTSPVEVTVDPDTIPPVIQYASDLRLCGGDTLWLSLPEALSWHWPTGDTTRTLAVTETGEYFALLEDHCKTRLTDTLAVTFLTPEIPVTTSDTFVIGEPAFLYASGPRVEWYADPFREFLIGTGNELVLNNLTDTLTVYAGTYDVIPGLEYNIGPAEHQGNTKYNGAMINGGLTFEVYAPLFLNAFTIFTDTAGARIIEITGSGGFSWSHQVFLEPGENIVQFEHLRLLPGSYTATTNTNLNIQEFGTNNPWLWRSNEGVLYPYTVPGLLSITGSTFGSGFYYYFYDWQISSDAVYCYSALAPATAYPDSISRVDDPAVEEVFVMAPNPTDGLTTLYHRTSVNVQVELYSTDGRKVKPGNVRHVYSGRIEIDMSPLSPGVYLAVITRDDQRTTRKVVRL